jgi:GGDEF domain-containing protein
MSNSGHESLAGGRYGSRGLSADLPGQLDVLHRSHRNFCARALQELRRAERYRQYISLLLIRENRAPSGTVEDIYRDFAGPLADLASLVRANSRITDLISGVEGGRFGILLVETAPDGARKFIARLEEMIESLFTNGIHTPGLIIMPVELISFPEESTNPTTLAEALNELYRHSSIRPHIY